MFRKLLAAAALIAALIVAFASWDSLSLLRRIDLAVFDSFQRAVPRDYDPETPVRIVAIDRAALEKFGQWPWPRSRMAQLVEKAVGVVEGMGARIIGPDAVRAQLGLTKRAPVAQ